MDLPQFGQQLRTLRQQAGWSQEALIEALDQLARTGPPTEYRVIDGTLLSRWEHARRQNGRTWKPTRTYTLHLIHLFSPHLDLASAQAWAAQAGYTISPTELQVWFNPPATLPQPTLPQPTAAPLAVAKAPTLAHNLPVTLTSFVGREAEISRLTEYLSSPTVRLVTLLGEGGVGKTRLALTVAQQLAIAYSGLPARPDTPQPFADGVWFVPLAGLTVDATIDAANAVATAIAQALAFTFVASKESPAEQLCQYLRPKALLLVLDNFEHLGAGVSLVVELLQQAPGVRLLVTSRAALRCQAEQIVRLSGLPTTVAANAYLVCAPCVQLFAQRARQQVDDFALTAATLPEVVRLCHLVDGNPLALELAAHWVQHLSVAEIVDALQKQQLDTLTIEQYDIPARQRSMAAVFETSWQLLSPQQQRVLAQLAVFCGSFTRQAALAVAGATLADLAALVDRSLLRQGRDANGRSYYLLHELLRQFAATKLPVLDANTPGLTQQVDQRHSDFYLQLIGERGKLLYGAQVQAELMEIQEALDNIRAAWRWAVVHGNRAGLTQAWFGLRTFYHVRTYYLEGEEVFRTAAAQLATTAPATAPADELWAELQIAQAFFLNLLHRYDEAVALAQQVIQSLAGQEERPALARAQLEWGLALSLQQNNIAEALTQLKETVQLAQRLQLPALEARALHGMGRILLAQGDYAQTCAVLEKALALYQQVGYRLAEGFVCYALGYSAGEYGDYSRAIFYLQKTQRIYEAAGDQARLGTVWKPLGETYLALGNLGLAYQSYQAAYTQQSVTHDLRDTTSMLASFGRLLAHLGEYDLALAYCQQALAHLQQINSNRMGCEVRWAVAWVHLQRGKAELALAQFRQLGTLAQSASMRVYAGLAHLGSGHALVQLERWAEAESAYQRALASQQETGQAHWALETGQAHLALETLSGLAQVALAQQQLTTALARVEEMIPALTPAPHNRTPAPFAVYLTCYQVWQAAGDPRAAALLADAYHRLQKQAASLEDEALRRSFLERVAVNRAICAAFANLHQA